MLLVVDVGNTNIVLGVFDKNRLRGEWRINTNPDMTHDEFSTFVSHMFTTQDLLAENISKIVVSSVVSAMNFVISEFCRKAFNCYPYWVDAKALGKMPNKYKNPDQLGSDRIVNAVAGYEKYKTSLIIIDMGTATTIDGVSVSGEYLGGAISPGLRTAAKALYHDAPRLPRVEFAAPDKVIGTDTLESLLSGMVFGYAGLVDGIVNRMKAQMGGAPKVVATGGLSRLMKDVSQTIEFLEPDLTLQGLRIIGERI